MRAGAGRAREEPVRIPVPTPYPVGPVNVYVLRGERPTLIDVGPRTKAAERELKAGLAAAGLTLQDVEQIVITHTHVDHHGLLEKVLAENPRVRVLAHRDGAQGFGRDAARRLAFYEGLFARSGMPEPIRGQVVAGLERMLRLEPKVPVDRWLEDGDLLPAGDGMWRVLHTPGHAGDLVSLYREATRTLIASDHLLPDVSSNAIVEPPPPGAAGRRRPLLRYMDALRKVASLPAERVLPGHGGPFADAAGLVAERLALHEKRLSDIAGQIPPRGTTAYALAVAMFAPQDGHTLTLAMSEVQGHLDVLEAREEIRAEIRPGKGSDQELVVYRRRGRR